MSSPLTKPWEEPVFGMRTISPDEPGNEDITKNFSSFAMASAWGGAPAASGGGPKFKKMYPPTGMAQISGIMAGMARSSRNQSIADDALMGAIARNKRLQANSALRFDRIWDTKAGASGYVSAFQLPYYVTANQPTYALMLSDEQILGA
ncbi:hypothetical protein HDV00_005624 [Rhizophlyctis rosea]|nr:hypothetical protein HDV00_005624 [Rhizophlyctis rosea]